MKTNYVSTLAISTATRSSLQKLQSDLVKASKESTTGRYADAPLELGNRAGYSVSLQADNGHLQSIIDSNALVTSRLDITQAALDGLRETASDFQSTLITAQAAEGGASSAQTAAVDALKSMISALNTNASGQYLFAGINTDQQPVADFFATPSAAASAVDAAFTSYFGFAPGDPAAAGISATAMKGFLDGPFSGLFDATSWQTDWSSASSQNVRSRVSQSDLIDTSVNANDDAFRSLAKAYVMVSALGVDALSKDTFAALVDKAVAATGQAINGVISLQSGLGVAQNRIADANTRMQGRIDIMTKEVTALESVDPYEAATRVNTLTSQIDTSYALTAKLQSLSLTKYL